MAKKATIATALFLIAGLTVWAQSPTQPPLTAEQIFEKNIEALGGRTALEHVRSWVKKGSKTGVVLPNSGQFSASVRVLTRGGTVEDYWKAPRQSLMILNAGTRNEVKAGSDEHVFWTSVEGVLTTRQPPGPASTGSIGNYFDSIASARKEAKVKLKGVKKVDGRSAYKIELSWTDGAQETRYYDTSSFLLLRTDWSGPGQMVGGMSVVSISGTQTFSDYREVSGVKFAFEVKSDAGQVTRYTEIHVNPELDDSIFQPPAVKKK